MVAGVFAGRDYRADFEGDPLLGDAETTDAYITVASGYVSLMHRWFDIPYGNAFVSMFIPVIVIHLLGFYFLGRILCRSRVLAVLLAIYSSVLINFDTWGEFWGLFSREPLNRVMIGALIGLFWSVAIYYGRKPRMRPVIMAAVGLSLWVHPVAAPVLGFSIWLGLWVMRSEDEKLDKFILNMFLSAGIFLLVLFPYSLQYTSSFGHSGAPPGLQKEMLDIMRNGYIDGYFRNEIKAIKQFFHVYLWQKPFLGMAMVALLGTIFLGGADDRRKAMQLGLMAVGILFVSDILFLLDHYVAMRAERIPLQADLVRGNRFLIPLSFAILFLSSAAALRRFGMNFGVPLSIIVTGFLVFSLQPNAKDVCLKLGQGFKVLALGGSPSNGPDVEMLAWLREQTPRKTSVTAFFNDLMDNTVRYVSLRPLKFSFKDPCFFNYFDWKKALEFQQNKFIYGQAMAKQDRGIRLQSAVKTALIFGSEVIVLDKGLFDDSYGKLEEALLWENEKYSVIDLGRVSSVPFDAEHPEFKIFATRSAYDHEVQTCLSYAPPTEGPHPLIVYLHSWSGTAMDDSYVIKMFELARERGYAILSPDFRGRNSRAESTGSELAASGITSAVSRMCELHSIDAGQIHLVGVSGGGYMSLIMAGRAPHLWKSVTVWCPIYDLAAWCRESELNGRASKYSNDIKKSLRMELESPIDGPYFSMLAGLRSPAGWLSHAGRVPINILVGINDGHGDNYVPVSHSLRAYNSLASLEDRLSPSAVSEITENRSIPIDLQSDRLGCIGNNGPGLRDGDSYPTRRILLCKASNNVRLTVFAGSHEMLPDENFRLISRWIAVRNIDVEVTAGPPVR